MIWFGKSFIKFCRSFINLIKLVSTRTCSSARVRSWAWSLPQELGHWFYSKTFDCFLKLPAWVIARWPAGARSLELGLRLEICSLTNQLLMFYLIWNPWINCVGFEFVLGPPKMQNRSKQWILSNPHPQTGITGSLASIAVIPHLGKTRQIGTLPKQLNRAV